MAFTAAHADMNFCLGRGVNTPTAFAPAVARLRAAAARTGRQVGTYVLIMVIADETDAAAMAKWQLYRDGADLAALDWVATQAGMDATSSRHAHSTQLAVPEGAVNFNMGTLVGSYASVARMLDEMATVEGTAGVLLTFDDFIEGIETFGERVQPLMRSRH